MEKLEIYNAAKVCPENAMRTIQAGKLKGKSDINPVWRIKKLTELFGPCGIGWKLGDITYWTEPGAGGEVTAWCRLKLYIKCDGEWSDGIEGVGGSMLVDTQRGNLATNDEAYKMAQTDAISVACKLLGFAADVYWNADQTKYSGNGNPPPPSPVICADCGKEIQGIKKNGKPLYTAKEVAEKSKETYGVRLCWACSKARQNAAEGAEGF